MTIRGHMGDGLRMNRNCQSHLLVGFVQHYQNSYSNKGGVVYGVVFSDDFRRAYYTSTDNVSRDRMKGSKYVMANKDGIYLDVKKQLETGRQVLFIGLPCEIAAIYSILGCGYDNLLTCELICAGPSSYRLLEEQLDWIERKKGERIKHFCFRAKEYGWVPYTMCADTSKGKYAKLFDETIFGVGMKYYKRDACFNCRMKGMFRVADFTVGDFWNIDKKASYYNDKGTSVIFCRTDKAERYLKKLDNLIFEEVTSEIAIKRKLSTVNLSCGHSSRKKRIYGCAKSGRWIYCL